MNYLVEQLQHYGLVLIYLNVLADQIGLPIPAYPVLILSGAMLSQGQYSAPHILMISVVATLMADIGWFLAGRRHGRKVMAKLCRISLSPDSCVRQSEAIFLRMGPPALLFCKFIPGFASIASAMAGALGTRKLTFLIYDGIGAAIWAGVAVGLGFAFSNAIDQLLDVLETMGKWGAAFILGLLVLFIASKWWQRYTFLKTLEMERISVDELYEMMQGDKKPIVIDVRPKDFQVSGRIPGAVTLDMESLDASAIGEAADLEVVLYCACPNEASAAQAAKLLASKGFQRIRPLKGGIDAWVAAGLPIE